MAGVDRNSWVLVGVGVVLVVAAVAATVSFTGGGSSSPQPRATEATPVTVITLHTNVDAVDNEFKPPAVQVRKGTTITWHFKGKVPHNVSSVSAAGIDLDSGIKLSGSFDFEFDRTGTFDYYCRVHPTMKATVYVTD
jgi:plastocyanin